MSEENGDSKEETVLAINSEEPQQEREEEKEVESEEKTVFESVPEKKPKKRTWTPARAEAWEKCLQGRKKFAETRKEILEKESEEMSLKEKVRIEQLKKKLKEEIQEEEKQKTKAEEKETHRGWSEEKPSKPKHVMEEVKSDAESEDSYEEVIVKKIKKKKRKVVFDDYEDVNEPYDPFTNPFAIRSTRAPPPTKTSRRDGGPSLRNFSFG